MADVIRPSPRFAQELPDMGRGTIEQLRQRSGHQAIKFLTRRHQGAGLDGRDLTFPHAITSLRRAEYAITQNVRASHFDWISCGLESFFFPLAIAGQYGSVALALQDRDSEPFHFKHFQRRFSHEEA